MATVAKFTQAEQAFTHKPTGGMGKYGTPKRRKEAPAHVFLDPVHRKYPYKVYKNGRWVISRRLLVAAIHRAAQYHHPEIEARARRLLKRYFGSQEERKGSRRVYVVSKKAIK